jgi:TonB family protein
MLVAFALAALIDAQAAPDGTGSINEIDPPANAPVFVQRPSGEEVSQAYPRAAGRLDASGRAVVHCQVSDQGGVAGCTILREFPKGLGFGDAAVSLAKYFRLDPTSLAAKVGEVDIPVNFPAPSKGDELLVTGAWIAAPSFEAVGAAYPDIGGGAAGEVELHCQVSAEGMLGGCKTLYVTPGERDFDKAALKLAGQFRIHVDQAFVEANRRLAVNLVVRIPAPFGDEFKSRWVVDPKWVALPDAGRMAALFPAAAKAKGVTSGSGMADCQIGADGGLKDCKPYEDGDPPELGFADAAAKAADEMRMAPWTDADGPVAGASVRVPVSFGGSGAQ